MSTSRHEYLHSFDVREPMVPHEPPPSTFEWHSWK